MKRTDAQIREYCRTLSDDQLRFLNMRFYQNYPGDRAEVLEVLSKNKSVDKFLSCAADCDDFFDCYDHIGDLIKQEVDRRKKAPKPATGPPVKRKRDYEDRTARV